MLWDFCPVKFKLFICNEKKWSPNISKLWKKKLSM